MTNTATRRSSASVLLKRGLMDSLSQSPFTHPLQVQEALSLAAKDTGLSDIPQRLQETVRELEDHELVERYQTKLGGRGGWRVKVRLTAEGKARVARMRNVATLVANGLI